MKGLHWFNFAGVILLAGLCVVQWKDNGRLQHSLGELRHEREEMAARRAEQDKVLAGLKTDLDVFKETVGSNAGELAEKRRQLEESRREIGTLSGENIQLKAGLTNWIAAVRQRDERLHEANETIQRLGVQLKDAVEKHNALAALYARLVQERARIGTNTTAAGSNK